MKDKTLVTEELIKALWSKFSKDKPQELRLIPVGFKNSSYLIKDNDGKEFVLKIYATNFLSDDIIRTDTDIVGYLEESKLPVIKIIKGLDGHRLQTLEWDSVRYQATCSVFVEAGMFKEEQLNKNKVQSVASELGKLHHLLSKYQLESKIRKLTPIETLEDMRTKQTVEKIREYFEENNNKSEHVEKFVKEYLHECDSQIKFFSKVLNNGLTKQLIHGDFNLSNIAFNQDNEITTIFDFDEVTLAPISFEIGCTLVHLDEGFMLLEDLVEYFFEEYGKHNKTFNKHDIEASIMFMRYRSLYRISRYFTFYRFSNKAVEHYTKYQYKLDRYKTFSF